MIATVTFNPAIDKSVTVHGFEVGKTNRCVVDRIDAGGKGINVARVLRLWGCEVRALGLAAGANGHFILEALRTEGISADFVTVPGETRVNLKIHDPQMETETEINEPGFQVGPDHLEALRRKVETYAPQTEVLVLSGSLPPGAPPSIFADLIAIAKRQGAHCILDTAGPGLAQGITAGPSLIKPNRVEVEELMARGLPTSQDLVQAAHSLIRGGCEQVLISLGAEGALGVAGTEALLARPPAVHVRSSVGAGDTMVAAMARAALEGTPFREAFRLAVAASAATVALPGTQMATWQAVQNLIQHVMLEDASS